MQFLHYTTLIITDHAILIGQTDRHTSGNYMDIVLFRVNKESDQLEFLSEAD